MNISNIKNCYGCGVCAKVCSKEIIKIVLNDEGFYEPRITDGAKCTDCGLCKDVCSYSYNDLSLAASFVKSYAAWSNEPAVRRKCSSGGVGFELGRTLINNGYKVCGVKYNPDSNRAEHYIATTVEELIPSIGSKYIQSYTVDGFKAINRKEKYLVTGTPCQIDSFRRYIRKFRLEVAAKLLLNTNFPVKEIAQMSGFNTVSYFCKIFRQVYKRSPQNYRFWINTR